MIQITPQMRIFVAIQAVDFRKGIDGLAGVCRRILRADPFNGYLFVFCNRRRTSIKLLQYDGQGYWLCQKRLSKGTFQWWPEGEVSRQLMAHQLQTLLWNGNPDKTAVSSDWKEISVAS